MPVVGTNRTSGGSNSTASTYNTASVTIPAGNLVLITVSSDTNAVLPTITGLGVTWTQVATASGGVNNQDVTLFRALSLSALSGVITINFADTGSLSTVGWVVDSFSSIDQTGSGGANAIVQSATNNSASANSLTVTLGAFSSSNNATYGTFVINSDTSITAGTGFTELGQASNSRPNQSEWRNDNDTSVDASFGVTAQPAGIAAEIKYSAIDLTKGKGSPSFFSNSNFAIG